MPRWRQGGSPRQCGARIYPGHFLVCLGLATSDEAKKFWLRIVFSGVANPEQKKFIIIFCFYNFISSGTANLRQLKKIKTKNFACSWLATSDETKNDPDVRGRHAGR